MAKDNPDKDKLGLKETAKLVDQFVGRKKVDNIRIMPGTKESIPSPLPPNYSRRIS